MSAYIYIPVLTIFVFTNPLKMRHKANAVCTILGFIVCGPSIRLRLEIRVLTFFLRMTIWIGRLWWFGRRGIMVVCWFRVGLLRKFRFFYVNEYMYERRNCRRPIILASIAFSLFLQIRKLLRHKNWKAFGCLTATKFLLDTFQDFPQWL